MKKFFALFSLLLISALCHAQQKWSVDTVMDKVEHYYTSKKEYCYSLDYKFFESRSSSKIIDQYTGQIIKKDKVTYQRINKVESIDFGDCIVSLDHGEKTFAVANTKSRTSPFSMKYLLKICSRNKLINSKKYWICELKTREGQQKQFEKINIYVNKKDFSIYKQDFYAVGSQEVEKNNKIQILKNPRIEILYQENSIVFANKTQILDRSYYFSVKNKKIMPSKRFQKYKLITQ